MDRIQELLEDYQDFSNSMLDSLSLSKEQHKEVLAEYIKKSEVGDLLEALLQSSTPKDVSNLLVKLYQSKKSDYKQISTKIVESIGDVLTNYYDTDINERLSEIWWKKENNRLDSLPPGNDFFQRQELLTPYGNPMFLFKR